MMKTSISRRTFLVGAAVGLAATRTARAQERGTLPPSDRLNVAIIGAGGQGHDDARTVAYFGHNVVAVCDVDWKVAGRVFEAHPEAKRHKDYRRMLEEQKDIDAVVIATPDHHHAFAAMAAMALGKHVYCEKPLTHSIYEARKLAKAARETKLATQMGNTGQASDGARDLAEMLRAGAIGPVREVHVWTNRPIWPQGIDRPAEEPAAPPELDWDLWLGPAPARPYHPIYHPFRWRGWWDFGTGALGDIACHRLHPVFKALDLAHPLSVEATSTKVNSETFPHASIIRYRFPARGEMPPLLLTWYDGGLKPPRPDELEPDRDLRDDGIIYVGDDGKIMDGRLIPEARMKDYTPPPKTLPRSIGHWPEWFEACKGGAAPGAHFEFAGMLTEVVLLGNIALRTGKKLDWDGEKVTNVLSANEYIRRDYREGWTL